MLIANHHEFVLPHTQDPQKFVVLGLQLKKGYPLLVASQVQADSSDFLVQTAMWGCGHSRLVLSEAQHGKDPKCKMNPLIY